MMMICKNCNQNEVDLILVAESYLHIFEQSNYCGMESLSETEQMIVEGKYCVDCLDEDRVEM